MILILKIWIWSRFLVTVHQNPRPEGVVVVGNFRSDLKQIISFKRGGCWRNFREAFFLLFLILVVGFGVRLCLTSPRGGINNQLWPRETETLTWRQAETGSPKMTSGWQEKILETSAPHARDAGVNREGRWDFRGMRSLLFFYGREVWKRLGKTIWIQVELGGRFDLLKNLTKMTICQ